MTHVEIFVGSQCHGNPGQGAWAAVLRVGRHEKALSGAEPHTTSNRLDLQAFTEALHILIEPCAISVHSPNRFLAEGFARWSGIWTPRGWSDANSKLVGFEQLLYARQPGYGPSYIVGKLQLDRLIADQSHADDAAGRPFDLKATMARIQAAGIVPVALIGEDAVR